MNKGGRSIFAALLLAGAFALAGCGGDDTSSGGTGVFGAGGGAGAGGGGTPPAATTPPPTLGAGCGTSGSDLICLTLSSSAVSLTADSSSSSTITVTLTRNGAPLSGQIVDFSLSSATLGSLTAANGVTSTGGTATTTFQAGGTIGAVGITATHAQSSASNTLALALTQPPPSAPGGIQFISATPSAVGVVGSGQTTTSAVVFRVTNPQGGAVSNQTVSFTMTGPAGAFIGPANDGSPTTATGTTNAAGDVSVPLNAGTAAGPVTIRADVTVGANTFTTSTSVISIGGAVPSAAHFSIATSRFNLPGFKTFGFIAQIKVFVADRFSNFNILNGTQVSFFTEAGAIDTSLNLNETGSGEVNIRTQDPMPFAVSAAHPNFPFARGHFRVIATARGEEAFADLNGNGIFNPGVDNFTAAMDLGEPFIDSNDNLVWDGPGCTQVGCDATHPGEQFVDGNLNGRYDPANGVWDGPGCTQAGCNPSPLIWTSIRLQFTGDISCAISPTTFALANGNGAGTSETFTITLADQNNNHPVPGTTVNIAVSGATAGGAGSFVVPDTVSFLLYTRSFTISDPAPATAAAGTATVTVTITTPSGEVATCGNSPLTVTGSTN